MNTKPWSKPPIARDVMALMKGLKRRSGPSKDGLKAEFDQFANFLKTEDKWFEFRSKAREFIGLYEAVSPDPSILEFTTDLKWVAAFLQYGTQVFEKREAFDQQTYSRKIREMLAQHLDATGLSVTVKLRHITDPDFWEDFETEGKSESDLKTAAIRKTTELRKVVTEKMAQNHHQYAKFSDRLRELLEKLDGAQLTWADKLKIAEELAKDLDSEAKAHEGTGLSAGAYGILQVLKAFGADGGAEALATRIEGLYTNDATAPPRWQEKDGLRRTLRQQVRGMAHELGLKDLKAVPEHVEAFALKHFAKV
jgi:type I restriction enzyme, R subunit